MLGDKDIIVGRTEKHFFPLRFNNYNAIILAGLSGKGKSQTAAFIATQFVLKGGYLVLSDYGSVGNSKEALLNRLQHLEHAFIQEPATEIEDIINHFKYMETLYEERRNTSEDTWFPILHIVDEFSAFIMNVSNKELDVPKVIALINKCRKVNIRFMFIGQSWAQISTQGMASLRRACSARIIHGIDTREVQLLEPYADKGIASLPVGYVYFGGNIMYVPSKMSESFKEKSTRKAKRLKYKWQLRALDNNQYLAKLLDVPRTIPRESTEIAIMSGTGIENGTSERNNRIDNKIKMLLLRGDKNESIYKAVGGNRATTLARIKKLREELLDSEED